MSDSRGDDSEVKLRHLVDEVFEFCGKLLVL